MRFSELDGARVGVWGAGREIGSLARQLARRLPTAEIAVAAFDVAPEVDVGGLLRAPDVRVATGGEALSALATCDVVVRSPGVSVRRPELEAIRASGIPVTTATALWLAEREGRGVIGITGTKGKSTVAALVAHLARAAGHAAQLAGNIGSPALDLLDHDPDEIAVVELSSYQIADLEVGPQVALVTNLYREHTDWHGSERAYRSDKLRLLDLPGVRVAVLSDRDERLAELRPDVEIRRYGLAEGWDVLPTGVALLGEVMVANAELPLRGEHNALNLCGALTALEAFGIEPPALPLALGGFRALAHRLETVADRDGVLWVDDSISTTPESALAALSSFPRRELILIAGGQDRGQDYSQLGRALAHSGAVLIGVPSTGPAVIAAAVDAGANPSNALVATDLARAVDLARARAQPGAVILLSPAAPSFDHYRDFEERGERFSVLARSDPQGR